MKRENIIKAYERYEPIIHVDIGGKTAKRRWYSLDDWLKRLRAIPDREVIEILENESGTLSLNDLISRLAPRGITDDRSAMLYGYKSIEHYRQCVADVEKRCKTLLEAQKRR